jgi:hypothetical protein
VSTTLRSRRRSVGRSRLRLGAGLALAVVLLTGCAGLQPGVAMVVGDDQISVNEVDELAGDICDVLKADPSQTQDSGPRSGSQLRNGALQSLALRSMADQIAAEHGVEAGQDYEDAKNQVELQYGGVDEDLVAAAMPAFTSSNYFLSIIRQVGAQESGAAQDSDEALTAGIQVAQQWQDDNEIETNPAFDSFRIGDTSIETERSDLARAAGDTAKGASSASADYIASLPSTQRCG